MTHIVVSKFFRKASVLPSLFQVLIVLLLVPGCQPQESIVRHQVSKERSGLDELHQTSMAPSRVPELANSQATDTSSSTTDRMIVGQFETDEATWFFKITGPEEQVTQAETQWKPFLESVRFADGKPEWDLPAGWSEGGPRPMRLATLKIGDDAAALEMAISPLGPGQDLLMNVNRWRGQLGLPSIQEAELDENVAKLNSEAVEAGTVRSAILFDAVGKSTGGMMPPFANAPFANRKSASDGAGSNTKMGDKFSAQNPEVGRKPGPVAQTPAANGFQFDTPPGWTSGATSGMVPVRLQKSEGDASVEITIVGLPAAANEWEPNLKRWAGQVGLPADDPQKLESLVDQIDVDGVTGRIATLIGDDEASTKATIAGMVKRQETAWFLKLTGDKALVVSNQQVFLDFLKSLKFPD